MGIAAPLANRAGLAALLALLGATPVRCDEAWTALIPDQFPGYVYTWQLLPAGGYTEEGRDAGSGKPIQSTLAGHWRRQGGHMVLRQDNSGYVFEGEISAGGYAGTLYLNGRPFSRFCAARGRTPPPHCDNALSV